MLFLVVDLLCREKQSLKNQGVDVPYMVKENEGHGFHNEENKFDFYRAMTEFLDKHLKN